MPPAGEGQGGKLAASGDRAEQKPRQPAGRDPARRPPTAYQSLPWGKRHGASLEEWNALRQGIREINDLFPDGVVFIGGVAACLHIDRDGLPPGFLEFSHDADLYFSRADFADLRDIEEVTANRRLNRHQIIRHGVEYDIYLERHNSLAGPYSEARAHSAVIDGMRVACLEHLLVLKPIGQAEAGFVLEVLAHGFHDYTARENIRGRLCYRPDRRGREKTGKAMNGAERARKHRLAASRA